MKKIIVALPPKLYVLRPEEKQDITTDVEEYNIYFENVILPYQENYDVKVECAYGSNYGSFWRISQFPYDTDSFPLKLIIYDEWGEKLAEKSCTVILSDKQENPSSYNVMCVGDSMTHSAIYVQHISHKLRNLNFVGIRSFDGHIHMEGRGGWHYQTYFESNTISWGGVSPFLFPKGVEPEFYYGDYEFEKAKREKNGLIYSYNGLPKFELQEGMIYHKEGKLWKYSQGEHFVMDENPVWTFSFEKYMKRFVPGKVDCVSLLMGGNDLQVVDYEDSEAVIEKFIDNTQHFIEGVRAYDPAIVIIINLPIGGADQMAWGNRMGCAGTAKQYRYNSIKAAQALIDKWGECKEHIYLSAMSLNLDRQNGFDAEFYRVNRYSDAVIAGKGNWVHPNRNGYMQMGDALAAVIEYVRV